MRVGTLVRVKTHDGTHAGIVVQHNAERPQVRVPDFGRTINRRWRDIIVRRRVVGMPAGGPDGGEAE